MKRVTPPAPPPTRHVASLCRRWVIALVIGGYDNPFIRASLAADDLPSPPDEELDALRAEYAPPGFKLRSKRTAALLKGLGLKAYFDQTPRVAEAVALLHDPRARETVEAALVAGVPGKAIVRTLDVHLKRRLSLAAIGTYRDLFFDVNAVSRAQLKAAVHAHVRIAVARAIADPDDEPAARRAVAADARSIAVALPSTPLAWSSAMLALGFTAGRRELADVIAQLESVATIRAAETLLRAAPDDDRRAAGFVGVLSKLTELRALVSKPEADVAKKLSIFRLQHATAPMKTVAELRKDGGEVTVDLLPPTRTGVERADDADDDDDEPLPM